MQCRVHFWWVLSWVNDKLDLSDKLMHQNKMIFTLKSKHIIYVVQKYQKVYITVGHYQFTSEIWGGQGHVGLCASVILKINWLQGILPHVKLEIQPPSTSTAATSVDKNSIICAVFTGCKHTESHLHLCLPSACFAHWVWILGSGGGFLRLAESSRVRRSRGRAT